MAKYSRFPMKYPNKCRVCNIDLSVGQHAWGTRQDNGKWVFLCEKCVANNPSIIDATSASDDDWPALTKPQVITDASQLSTLLEVLESAAATIDDKAEPIAEAMAQVLGKESKLAPVMDGSNGAKPPTLLELIEKNAAWRFEYE